MKLYLGRSWDGDYYWVDDLDALPPDLVDFKEVNWDVNFERLIEEARQGALQRRIRGHSPTYTIQVGNEYAEVTADGRIDDD